MFEALFQQWLPISGLIIFISLAIITIIYIISRILDNDNAKKWAQNEIYQVIASAFLLGSIVLFINIIDNILINTISLINPAIVLSCNDNGCSFNQLKLDTRSISASPSDLKDQIKIENIYCGQSVPCHIAIARSMLDQSFDIIRYYLANKIITVGWLQYIVGLEIAKISPFAFVNNISFIYTTFIKIGFNFLLLLKANSIFLLFVNVSLFPAFIISGLALRSISILRRLGGLLFAIAIGTYFVYPILIIFSLSLIQQGPYSLIYSFTDNSGFSSIDLNPNNNSLSSNLEVITPNVVGSQEDLLWYQKLAQFGKDIFEKYLFIKLPNGDTVDFISYITFRTLYQNGFLDSIAMISVWILVPFIISLYVLIVFIKELSSFVGGDIDIAGLSKLI